MVLPPLGSPTKKKVKNVWVLMNTFDRRSRPRCVTHQTVLHSKAKLHHPARLKKTTRSQELGDDDDDDDDDDHDHDHDHDHDDDEEDDVRCMDKES